MYLQNNNITLRPNKNCKKNKNLSVKCLGLPSGHTEITTLICYILYSYKYLSLFNLIIIIFLMSLQRIISKNHTILQTLIGIIFGLFYSFIYLNISITYKTILLAIMIICIYIYIIINKIDF